MQALLYRLLRTVEYQPTSGKLFTAQTPLFSVFIGGIVAYKPEDRAVICAWFDPVCKGSRGNVPPAYAALKQVWDWLDKEEAAEFGEGYLWGREAPEAADGGGGSAGPRSVVEGSEDVGLGQSEAWWEQLMTKLVTEFGRINLS